MTIENVELKLNPDGTKMVKLDTLEKGTLTVHLHSNDVINLGKTLSDVDIKNLSASIQRQLRSHDKKA